MNRRRPCSAIRYFDEIAVTDTVHSMAATEGWLPHNIVHLDSSKLVAHAIMVAHSGR
jgi:hypothetical protein